MDKTLELQIKMQEIFFRLEFHFTIAILEINNEITIDLKISGEGIRMKDGRIDLDHWVENN